MGHKGFRKGQTKRKHVLSNTETDTNEFLLRRGVKLPQWWLKFADGHPVTHVYRLIDDDNGLDTKIPKVTEAMSHKLKPEAVVDFSDKQVKQQAITHVDKSSEGDMGQRPYLSTSLDLESLSGFGMRKITHWENLGRSVQQKYARIDLIAL